MSPWTRAIFVVAGSYSIITAYLAIHSKLPKGNERAYLFFLFALALCSMFFLVAIGRGELCP